MTIEARIAGALSRYEVTGSLPTLLPIVRRLIEEAVAEEREACAQIADTTYRPFFLPIFAPNDLSHKVRHEIVKAIRARGEGEA